MYTTIIHPLRKALNLSIREYVILDTVYHLSHNDKYGGWCIATKRKLAEWSDLGEATVYRILGTLEEKDLITRDEATGYIKTKDTFNELIANKEDWMIGFKGKESAFLSGKTGNNYQNDRHTIKTIEGGYQNDSMEAIKMIDNNNKDNNINNILPKGKSKAYGKEELNNIKRLLIGELKIDDFKESRAWQRKHLQNLYQLQCKLGIPEFVRRLNKILDDDFKRKNCNSLSFVYKEMKGYIEVGKRKKVEPLWKPPT